MDAKARRVDNVDREIIRVLAIDPRAPFTRIAEVVGVSEQTVARRFRALHGGGVVRVVGELDTQRLGRSDWVLRIRCVPGGAAPLATALARRTDTAWVQLTSGGTEVFCTMRGHDVRRTALLEQLPSSRQIVALDAHLLLHMFKSGPSGMSGLVGSLEPEQVDQLQAGPEPSPGGRAPTELRPEDQALVRALARDGRASYRQLAARVHWHESTVRRRVEELVASGALVFELDVATELLGVGTRALLWISVAPARLLEVGRALADRPEVPFAAATTGPTNLLASVACRDDAALFEFLTRRLAALDGVGAVETAPIIRAVKRAAAVDLSETLPQDARPG